MKMENYKEEWLGLTYTPHTDEDVAAEEAMIRSVIAEARFPNATAFTEYFIQCNANVNGGYLQVYRDNTVLVYTSVAKLFYASCTDGFTTKAKQIGRMLHEEGGMQLMRCVYYGLSWLVRMLLQEKGINPGYAQVVYIDVERDWNGIGEWVF